jgi:hypothetical protein
MSSHSKASHSVQQLERKITRLHNELEFVDILAQFWPWDNMTLRASRLQEHLLTLKQQQNQLLTSSQARK